MDYSFVCELIITLFFVQFLILKDKLLVQHSSCFFFLLAKCVFFYHHIFPRIIVADKLSGIQLSYKVFPFFLPADTNPINKKRIGVTVLIYLFISLKKSLYFLIWEQNWIIVSET